MNDLDQAQCQKIKFNATCMFMVGNKMFFQYPRIHPPIRKNVLTCDVCLSDPDIGDGCGSILLNCKYIVNEDRFYGPNNKKSTTSEYEYDLETDRDMINITDRVIGWYTGEIFPPPPAFSIRSTGNEKNDQEIKEFDTLGLAEILYRPYEIEESCPTATAITKYEMMRRMCDHFIGFKLNEIYMIKPEFTVQSCGKVWGKILCEEIQGPVLSNCSDLWTVRPIHKLRKKRRGDLYRKRRRNSKRKKKFIQ